MTDDGVGGPRHAAPSVAPPWLLRALLLAVAVWTASFSVTFNVVGNALLKAGAVLCTVGWLVVMGLDRTALRATLRAHARILALIAVFFLWVFASVLWAADQGRVVSELWKQALVIEVFLIVLTVARTRSDVLVLVLGWAVGGVLLAASAIGSSKVATESVIDPLTTVSNRFAGAAGDPNVLAIGVVAAAILLCGLAAAVTSTRSRWFLLCPVPLLAVVAAGSSSRGGAVAALVAVVTAAMLLRRNVRHVVLVLVPVTVAATAWFIASPVSWTRITAFGEGSNGRGDLWKVAERLIVDHPLLGVGADNFRTLAPTLSMQVGPLENATVVDGNHVVHNAYLQYAVETGLVGLALFIAILALSVRDGLRASRLFDRSQDPAFATLTRCVVIATAAMLAGSMFISGGREYRVWALLAFGPVLLRLATRQLTSDGGAAQSTPSIGLSGR